MAKERQRTFLNANMQIYTNTDFGFKIIFQMVMRTYHNNHSFKTILTKNKCVK